MRCSLIISRTAFLALISCCSRPRACWLRLRADLRPRMFPCPAHKIHFWAALPKARPLPMSCKSTSRTRSIVGLRNNLGLLLAGDQTETARGQRWKELSELLPNLSAHVMEDVQTQSLAALGFNKLFPLLAAPGTNTGSLPRLVPPSTTLTRALLSASQSSISRTWRRSGLPRKA